MTFYCGVLSTLNHTSTNDFVRHLVFWLLSFFFFKDFVGLPFYLQSTQRILALVLEKYQLENSEQIDLLFSMILCNSGSVEDVL